MSRGEIPVPASSSASPGSSVGTAVVTVILQRALTGTHTAAAVARGFQQSFLWAVFFTAIAVPVSCCREDPS